VGTFLTFRNLSLYAGTGTTGYECTPTPPSLQGTSVAVLFAAGCTSRPELRIFLMLASESWVLSQKHVFSTSRLNKHTSCWSLSQGCNPAALRDQYSPPADSIQLAPETRRKITICHLFLTCKLSIKDVANTPDESYKHVVDVRCLRPSRVSRYSASKKLTQGCTCAD
jgi:hypothetical protein